MLNSINSDLIRGHIDTIILSVLHEGDRYGYDILGEIEKKSNGQYSLKQPTLYSCLKRLEGQGFIYKYWGAETNGGRRTYYSLTEMGKELFKRNKDEWEHSRGIIDQLISSSDSPVKPYIVADVQASPTEAHEEKPEVKAKEFSDQSTDNPQTEIVADTDKISDSAYAEILAEAEKNEILRQSEASVSEVSDVNNELRGVSYADKLKEESVAEKSVEKERDPSLINSVYMSDNVSDYFKDYEEDEDEEDLTSSENVNVATENKSYEHDTSRYSNVPDNTDLKHTEIETEDYRENIKEYADEKDEKEIVKPNYDDKQSLFRSYNNAELSEETDREIIVAREYRNVIRKLLKGGRDDDTPLPNYSQTFENNEYIENSTQVAAAVTEGSEEYKVRDDSRADFSNLLVAVRSMGDDIRIRTHNSSTDKEYSNLYHYYSIHYMNLLT